MLVFAYFSNKGTPATGLSPTLDIIDLSDDSVAVDDAAMSEVASGGYKYDFTTFDSEKDYYIICDGGATLNEIDRYSISTTGDAGSIERIKEVSEGRWKIEGNQLKLYKLDGLTVLKTYNLKDASGNPASDDVFERSPV